jgi:aryl-alcohol dehydrogenase-like predicted oxidoreductase
VTCSIVGPVSVEQLDQAVGSLEVRLEEKVLARLDEIFPGYRTAPEDYAW